jgi:tetratricopeptide (TPR) repeat protein
MAKALRGLGRTAEALGPLARARDLLGSLRLRDPNYIDAVVDLARCMRFLGDAQAAVGRRDEAIQRFSASARVLEEGPEEDRRRSVLIVANLAVIYGDLGELQRNSGRLADAERTLLKAEDLGQRYDGQDGRVGLNPIWLAPARTSLGLMWKDMGKTREARDILQRAEATLQSVNESDFGFLQILTTLDSALAELAAPGLERAEYDRRAAESFRRAVAAAESGNLAGLATEPRYARLRARPELEGLLLDRMFPRDSFAR